MSTTSLRKAAHPPKRAGNVGFLGLVAGFGEDFQGTERRIRIWTILDSPLCVKEKSVRDVVDVCLHLARVGGGKMSGDYD